MTPNTTRLPIFLVLTMLMLSAPVRAEPPDSTPFRIAVIGLVHGHVEGVLSNARDRDDIEIVGVWDPSRELFDKFKDKYKLPNNVYFDDLGRMLDRTRPEAASVMTSTKDHLMAVEACTKRGVHAMVEKPLAANMDDARKIAMLAAEHDIHVLTNYETSWYASNHQAHAMATDGTLGDIRRIVVHDGHQGPIEIGCAKEFTDWLCDPVPNGGGGAIMDFGCYGANLSTWIHQNKRPLTVTAVTQQIKPHMYPKVDDDATIILTYDDSVTIIQASWNWTYDRKDLHVYGTRGYVHADRREKMAISMDRLTPVPTTAEPRPQGYENEWTFFKHVAQGHLQPDELSSLENNLIVMEILDAAKESAGTGRTVRLGK